MQRTPRAWSVAGPVPLVTGLLHRFGLHPGGSWSLGFVSLFAAGALMERGDSTLALAGAHVLGALFAGFNLVGALAYVGRRVPLWILPAAVVLGLVRTLVWLRWGPVAGHGFSLLYEPHAHLAAALLLLRAPLLAGIPVTRWSLLVGLVGLAALEGADAVAPALGGIGDTRAAWYVVAPLTAFLEVCAMWPWIARRELRIEEAEQDQRELEDEVGRERRAVDLLRRKEAWLFDFFERAPDMLLVLVPGTSEIVRCNRRFSETIGYARKELAGRPLLDFVDPATLETVRPVLAQSRRRLRNLSLRLLRHDGKHLVVLANLALRSDPDGVEEVRAVLHDVTRLRSASGEPDAAPLYRELTTRMSVGVFASDDTGHCRFVNPSFCELSGLSPERARDEGWLGCVHPEDRARVETTFRAAARDGTSFRIEHRVVPRPGSVHRVLTEGVPGSEGAGFVGSMALLEGPGARPAGDGRPAALPGSGADGGHASAPLLHPGGPPRPTRRPSV